MLSHFLRAAAGQTGVKFISKTDVDQSATSSFAITTPAGAANGDILIVFFSQSTSRTNFTNANFTNVYTAGPATNPSGNTKGVCSAFVLTGAPAASYTFTCTLGTTAVAASMLCYRPSRTITQSAVFSTTTQSGTSLTAPTITASVAGLLLCGYFVDTFTGAITPPAGMTVRTNFNGASATRALCVTELSVPTGATGTKIATIPTSTAWNAGSLILPKI